MFEYHPENPQSIETSNGYVIAWEPKTEKTIFKIKHV